MKRIVAVLALAIFWRVLLTPALASTNIFFNASQIMTVVGSNLTAVTVHSEGYLFTYSRDGYFTGGVGMTNPVGRFFSVFWPNGVQAQAYTAGPLAGNGANITIKRADGKLFNLQSFTGKILLNTAAAGGAFEVTPQLNGNDAPGAPLQYDCTGYAGWSFPYTTSLVGYDTYQIHMWGDFALTTLVLTDTNPVVAPVSITNTIAASASPAGAGFVGGAGNYPSNSPCALTASPNLGWGFKNWTQNGTQVSTSATYNFTVKSNRTLVANFVPAYNVTTAVAPAFGGTATGSGTFNSNTTVTVRAMAASGFQFVNWTDYGTPVSTATNYSFTITGNHSLTAVFITNTPPVALGGNFFQLTNTPLAINIADLTAFDYDPDGDLIYFTGTSALTAHGLALTNDGVQIFLPVNPVADSFTYTIEDGNGGSATGTANISIINSPAGNPVALDLKSLPGTVLVNFTGVPWYAYTIQRATNAAFTGTVQSWSAQAWTDGSITLGDNFADLGQPPAQAFYRLIFP